MLSWGVRRLNFLMRIIRRYGMTFPIMNQILSLTSWSRNGDVMEYRQDRIPESQYYSHIGSPLDQKWSDRPGDADVPQTGEDIRYWSDFSRVYYLPRTIQTIPDHGHRASTEGDWNMGQDEFFRYNEVGPAFSTLTRLTQRFVRTRL